MSQDSARAVPVADELEGPKGRDKTPVSRDGARNMNFLRDV